MKMKRQREDHHHHSQPQSSSFSSTRENFDQPERMGGATKIPTSIDALGYLKVVKTIFHNEIEKYEYFIILMKDFKAKRIDTIGIREKIKELFKGHHELIVGFNAFLPKEYKIKYLEDEQCPQKKHVDFIKAYKFVSKLKVKGAAVYQSILRVLYAYRRENKSVMDVYLEVAMLLQDQDDLLEEFNYFLPDSSSRSSINCAINMDMPINSSTLHMDGGTKSLYDNVDASVDCTNHPIDDLNRENKEVVGRQEELDGYCENDGYRDVNLTHVPHNWHSLKREAFFDGSMDDGVENRMHQLSFTNDDKHAMGEHLVSSRALPISMEVYYNDRDHDSGWDRIEEDSGSPEMDEHSQRIAITNIGIEEHKGSLSKNKFIGKSINELDWSNCKRCTPSYRLLPANYPLPSAGHWTELGSEVLNDRWVSVTSGSEDFSFKQMQKNQYEDAIFQCEDDRVEMDLLVESLKTTIKHIGEFLDKANCGVVTVDAPICLDDHFSTFSLRCIERLYGDHGLDVVNLLRKKPFITLPIILTRLNQKQEEWIKCHADFKKVWDEIYFKNYKKSLDHNSFCLKQQDMKSMRKKVLLTEINEITEKKSKENDKIFTFSGKRCSMTSNMEFEYLDSDIHEDLYQLIMYSSREFCATEQFAGIMKIWMTFLEPMLNVPSRLKDPDEPEGMNEIRKMTGMSFVGGPTTSSTVRETDKLLKNGEGCIESDLAAFKSELELDSSNKRFFLIEHTGASFPCTSNIGMINKGNIFHKQNDKPAIRLKIRRVASLEDVDSAKDDTTLSRQCHPPRQREEIISQEPWRKSDAIAEAEANVVSCQLEAIEADEMDWCNDIKGKILPFEDHTVSHVKPISVYHPQKFHSQHKASRVFYGNDSFYILFRLHQILYERIRLAKIKASSSEVNWRAPSGTTSCNPYSRFTNALYKLTDGTYDNSKFEDECRTIMGTQSYMLFTLDKLLRKLIKQLLIVATNKMELQLLVLHANENSRIELSENLADNDSSYLDNAQFLLGNQNMYLIKSE